MTTSPPASSSPSAAGSGAGDQLDEQSAAWFATVCTGLTAVQQVQPPTEGAPLGPAGETLVTAGQTLSQTAQELQSQPAPTFTGADEFAPNIQDAFATVGGRFTELGQQAQALQPGDTAGAQQFLADYGSSIQEIQQTLGQSLNLRRSVLQAAVAQVPDCQLLSGAAG